MAGDPLFFAWIDLETTGLDKYDDPIIEIGLVVTRVAPPCDEVDSYTAVALPADPHWTDRMNTYVLDMHTRNGLIADIEREGRPLQDIEHEILSVFMRHGRAHNFMLAGSAVGHFDRVFIAEQMPKLNKWLQPPCLDVGVLRRALKFSGRRDLEAYGETFQDGGKPHRGLADVRDHLNEYRQYTSIIQSIPGEGSHDEASQDQA